MPSTMSAAVVSARCGSSSKGWSFSRSKRLAAYRPEPPGPGDQATTPETHRSHKNRDRSRPANSGLGHSAQLADDGNHRRKHEWSGGPVPSRGARAHPPMSFFPRHRRRRWRCGSCALGANRRWRRRGRPARMCKLRSLPHRDRHSMLGSTRSGGLWLSRKVRMLMITFSPISTRPSMVAEPICGSSAALPALASRTSFGLTAGSCS